ncbi:MAG: hypothetical protein PHX13_09210 [Thiovulaceae bacterium]|nr:hypothetical protein [Sulfurimonadaceae bacterium]
MINKNGIIIVRYENEISSFMGNISELSKKYRLYVYDNSKEGLKIENESIYYFHDKDNGGLAKGINHCLNIAIEDQINYIVYFDQDSKIDISLISNLFNSYIKYKKKYTNILLLGPQPIMSDGGIYPIKLSQKIEDDLYLATEIITSGMTFEPLNIKAIGGFDEDLFLDMIDFELCWRAKEEGFLVVVDRNIKMGHEVGINTIKLPFKVLPISSPIRNYYQMRNVLYLALYKHKKSKLTILYYILRRLMNITLNLLFVDNKILRLKYNYLAIKDAINKNMGKFKS